MVMKRYRVRSEVVHALRWNLPDDHSAVVYYQPPGPPTSACAVCGNHDYTHGWLPSKHGGGTKVCPGDWVIRPEDGGDLRTCKPAEFVSTYERVFDDERR